MSPDQILDILQPMVDEFMEKHFRPFLTACRIQEAKINATREEAFAQLEAGMIEVGASEETKKYYRALLSQRLDPSIDRLLAEIPWPNRPSLRAVK
jgi:hypothetical protein